MSAPLEALAAMVLAARGNIAGVLHVDTDTLAQLGEHLYLSGEGGCGARHSLHHALNVHESCASAWVRQRAAPDWPRRRTALLRQLRAERAGLALRREVAERRKVEDWQRSFARRPQAIGHGDGGRGGGWR